MFRVTAIVLLLAVLPGITVADNLLNGPEGVVWDSVGNRWLVSNWFGGTIVQIDPDGTQSYFRQGLNHPSGIHIRDTVLYVACDNRTLLGLSLSDGTTTLTRVISTQGLHGITSDTSGALYACDWSLGRVFQIDPTTGAYTSLVIGINRASGITFDKANNRLLVVGFDNNNDVTGVALPGGETSVVATIPFPGSDDIQQDPYGHYYISTHNVSPAVYKFDNAFTLPGEPLCDGYGLMTDCYFNHEDNTLMVTSYTNNSYQILEQIVTVEQDTALGWTPLEVGFEGLCDFAATEYSWDFGDGDTDTGATPTHVYDTPGLYDVLLTVVTATGDTLSRLSSGVVAAIADTLWSEATYIYADSSVDIQIFATNQVPLNSLTVPVDFGLGDLEYDANLVGWSTAGCRTDHFDFKQQVHFDPMSKRMTFTFENTGSSSPLAAGSGPVLTLHFPPPENAQTGQSTVLALTGYSTRLPQFVADLASYSPAVVNGELTIISCCQGITGNVDGDPEEQINISDLVYLVTYMFSSGPAPVCMEETNIDGDEQGLLAITDLVHLVEYMFSSGPEPAPCL